MNLEKNDHRIWNRPKDFIFYCCRHFKKLLESILNSSILCKQKVRFRRLFRFSIIDPILFCILIPNNTFAVKDRDDMDIRLYIALHKLIITYFYLCDSSGRQCTKFQFNLWFDQCYQTLLVIDWGCSWSESEMSTKLEKI